MNSQRGALLLFYLLPAGDLVTLTTGQSTSSSVCPTGWFGPGCMYQCHCHVSDSCSNNGDCPNNEKCDPDYFGPACQYREALKWRGSFVDNYLMDDNDATCNPVPNAKSVVVTMSITVALTWFRLVVNNNTTLMNFTTKVNGNEYCVHETKYRVDANTVDVTCDGGVAMRSLSIVGPVAPSICSLYLSGGRNTALKQHVNITNQWGSADKSVDGNTDPFFLNDSCTMTSKSDNPAVLGLSYDRLHYIHSIVIYNRDDYAGRLYLTSVTTFNTQSSQIGHYFSNESGVSILNITMEFTYPVSEIRVRNGVDYGKRKNILIICELEAWGDNACPDRTYGLDCKNCSCKSTELCNVYTGGCSHCPDGFFWLNCSSPCSTTCLNDSCSPHTGTCLDCKPGFTGDFCTKVCDPGQYGQGCKLPCPMRCSPYCDKKTGACLRCSDGFYGHNCTKTCPQFCRQKQCHRSSGECVSCPGHRVGARCAECTDGFYGENCTEICSRFCELGICEQYSGYCFSCSGNSAGFQCNECSDGFYGTNCTEVCPTFCTHRRCTKTSGECFSCRGYRSGVRCDDCNNGFHGDNCTDKMCSQYCRQGKCQTSSGHCLSCLGNRAGFGCDVCVTGFYGENCTDVCPEFCLLKRCHRDSGECYYCQHRRAGTRCTDCSDGYYGANCTAICSRFCLHRKCHRNSGECFMCLGNRSLPHCADCTPGRYGLQCDQRCSRFCVNSTCDQLSGKCCKCSLPQKGILCLSIPEKPLLWAAPIAIFPFLLLLVFFLPYCVGDEDIDSDDLTGLSWTDHSWASDWPLEELVVVYDDEYDTAV